MALFDHATHLYGREITEWEPPADDGGDGKDGKDGKGAPGRRPKKARKSKKPSKPSGVYRISLDYEDAEAGQTWVEKFRRFVEDPAARSAVGLVIGPWEYEEMVSDAGATESIVEALVTARDRLPKLRAIYFGDITSEECEMSWIHQTDVAPLLAAYPNLEEFRVRGSDGLSLGTLNHRKLRKLAVESGGLPAAIVREIGAAKLPSLEHLEVWLGTPDYGGDATVADLKPILSPGKRFPKLKYLGLRDSAIADQIAKAVVRAPVLARLKVLDLSLGNLTDDGAAALLLEEADEKMKKLTLIDISHHYVSPWMLKELNEAGLKIDASDPQEPYVSRWTGEIDRFVAVGE